ncbi:MAG TPA: response regulator transcription factor [Spirochaetes bacterium]|nr:response regulator transcription factor [Spirochaetota bacterium]
MTEQDKIKVCIIDDDLVYRDHIKSILIKDDRIRLYGEYSSALAFIPQLNAPFQPDVCLVDMVMPEMLGIECARLIKLSKPHIHVILITGFPTQESMTEAREIGADYVQKGTIGEKMMDKIITNLNADKEHFFSLNRSLIDPSIEKANKKALQIIQHYETMQDNVSKLSPTQRKVIQLRKENKSVSEIASELNMTIPTVTTHLHRGLKKLNIPNLLEHINIEDDQTT